MGADNLQRAEMQLLTIFALLCVLGPTLSTRAQPKHCQKPATSATKTCYNEANYTLRFTYNYTSGKCDQIWRSSCSRRSNNSFGTFKECMNECNPDSPCLKTPKKAIGFWFASSHVFDVDKMECIQEESFRLPSIGPEYNRFQHRYQCEKTCKPLLQLVLHG
uniref:Putative tick kunitz 1 n=1 Tax=Amblyomma americanum TaxID=6943 RepID=A0A0C9R5M8_AMBAM